MRKWLITWLFKTWNPGDWNKYTLIGELVKTYLKTAHLSRNPIRKRKGTGAGIITMLLGMALLAVFSTAAFSHAKTYRGCFWYWLANQDGTHEPYLARDIMFEDGWIILEYENHPGQWKRAFYPADQVWGIVDADAGYCR